MAPFERVHLIPRAATGVYLLEPMRLTAAIYRVGDGFVARCLETDVVSQGGTVQEAQTNLVEALELHYQGEDRSEIAEPPVIVPIDVFVS